MTYRILGRLSRTIQLSVAVPPMFFLATTALAADGVPDRCLKCHSRDVVLGKVAKMPEKERAAKLDRFLTGHFAPDATERAAIVAALKAMADKR